MQGVQPLDWGLGQCPSFPLYLPPKAANSKLLLFEKSGNTLLDFLEYRHKLLLLFFA